MTFTDESFDTPLQRKIKAGEIVSYGPIPVAWEFGLSRYVYIVDHSARFNASFVDIVVVDNHHYVLWVTAARTVVLNIPKHRTEVLCSGLVVRELIWFIDVRVSVNSSPGGHRFGLKNSLMQLAILIANEICYNGTRRVS